MAEKNFDVLPVAATTGSRHPFIFQETVSKFIEREKAKHSLQQTESALLPVTQWILSEEKRLGSTLRLAQNVKTVNGKEVTVNALSFRDIFDSKSDSKFIRLFETGSNLSPSNPDYRTWVMIQKPFDSDQNKSKFIVHPDRTVESYRGDELTRGWLKKDTETKLLTRLLFLG